MTVWFSLDQIQCEGTKIGIRKNRYHYFSPDDIVGSLMPGLGQRMKNDRKRPLTGFYAD